MIYFKFIIRGGVYGLTTDCTHNLQHFLPSGPSHCLDCQLEMNPLKLWFFNDNNCFFFNLCLFSDASLYSHSVLLLYSNSLRASQRPKINHVSTINWKVANMNSGSIKNGVSTFFTHKRHHNFHSMVSITDLEP